MPGRLLASTLGWTCAIGLIATLLAIPAAWAVRGWGRRAGAGLWPWLILPAVLPSYLAYSGWGMLRAPGTWLGNALERGPQWGPVLAGRVLAMAGLALWATPIATAVLSLWTRRVDDSVLQALELDGAGRVRRVLVVGGFMKAGLVSSVALVALLMTGSAIPLHLAQTPTLSVQVWLALDSTPAHAQWAVWLMAWPVALAAVGAGWLLGGRAVTHDPGVVLGAARSTVSRGAAVGAIVVLLLAVGVPTVLFALSVRQPAKLMEFWALNSDAVSRSVGVAAAVALVGFAIGLGCAWASAGGSVGLAKAVVRALLISGLLPGVLVGSSMLRALGWLGPVGNDLGDTPLILVIAHLCRFAMVPAVAGCVLGRLIDADERSLRRMEGAEAPLGFVGSLSGGQWAMLGACALLAGAMSLHEIESAVVVSPPGDSLARLILGYLHQSRDEDLSAATLWMVAMSGAVAAGVAWGFGRATRAERPAGV